jgi:hypothetical protein
MKTLVIALALLGVSTTAAMAGNDNYPIIYDVATETRQCLDIPEIKYKARDPARACEYLVAERARLEAMRAECLEEDKSPVFCKAVVERYVEEYWPSILNKALVR